MEKTAGFSAPRVRFGYKESEESSDEDVSSISSVGEGYGRDLPLETRIYLKLCRRIIGEISPSLFLYRIQHQEGELSLGKTLRSVFFS